MMNLFSRKKRNSVQNANKKHFGEPVIPEISDEPYYDGQLPVYQPDIYPIKEFEKPS